MPDLQTLRYVVAHDPCNGQHRRPLGAVTAGTPVDVTLWVDPQQRSLVPLAWILVGEPLPNGEPLRWRKQAMEPCADGFTATVPGADHPETLFYLPLLNFPDGAAAYLTPRPDGRTTAGKLVPAPDGDPFVSALEGEVLNQQPSAAQLLSPERPGFQITFYDPAFTTPDWLAGAVMYQIFPDRFARGAGGVRREGIAYHERMKRPVHLRAEWDTPITWNDGAEYDPDEFAGGTLAGIRGKLPYLASLGVGVLYLNPVFEARSYHRYDTADYGHIDPLLGTDDDFRALAAEARKWGIRILLDAVLSHTGADSRYFNAAGTYPEPGAAQGPGSPCRAWYDFENPNGTQAPYRCWWGDPTLPEVDERNASWQRYILGEGDPRPEDGEKDAPEPRGILPRWVRAGAAGYRLDVADEIPDDVLERIRHSVKAADAQAAIIGEVWEDATSKVSYDVRRTYALGNALDSVMNYPLRDALLGFATGMADARQLATFLKTQKSNYPAPMYRCLMNLMSSHDVERQRSVIAAGRMLRDLPRGQQAQAVSGITREQDEHAAKLQCLLAGILYALPGMPCLYYGDERGLHGGGDPFCRATFPETDGPRADCGRDLTAFYQRLGQLRRRTPALRDGDMTCRALTDDALCILRAGGSDGGAVIAFANRGEGPFPATVDLCELVDGPIRGQVVRWRLQPIWSSVDAGFNSEDDAADSPARITTPTVENGVARVTIPAGATVYFRAGLANPAPPEPPSRA